MAECQSIFTQLSSGQTELVREAAYNAGESRCEESVPLLAGLLRSKNIGIQEAAEVALRKLGGASTVRSVLPLLRSDEAPVRNVAMDILRSVGDQDFESLVTILRDDDADIRIFAADILGSTRNVLAVAPLCDALLKDPEVNVRYQAAVSLGDLAFHEGARCLNRALEDEEWVQFAVIEALAKIKDDTSVGALVLALSRTSDLVASMIVDALGEMGNIKAVNLLLRRMDASPTALRNKIVKAVVKILGGKSLALLTEKEREKFRDYLLVAIRDEDVEIQDAAIHGLGYLGNDAAAVEILDLAGKMNPELDRERILHAIDMLVAIGPSPALVQVLNQDDGQKATVAVEVMARLKDNALNQALMQAFWAKGRDIQREIVSALLRVAGPEDTLFFMDILDRHNDGTVLKGAIAFLGMKVKAQQAGEKLFGLLDHPYDDVKEAALEACLAIFDSSMRERFEDFFRSENPVHRLMAVYALGKSGDMTSKARIEEALGDEVPDVRKVAVEALVTLCGSDESVLPVLAGVLSDEVPEVRMAVVEVLGKMALNGAVPLLMQGLDDGNDWVRIRSMEALAERKETSAIPLVIPLLHSENTLLVIKSIACLGEIGGRAAFRALLELTSHDDPQIQSAAAEAVAKIQDQEEVR
jgi:HEAT repeat protein